MNAIDCAVGEESHFCAEIRIQLTGRVGGALYVFIEADRAHALERHPGFSGRAVCGRRRSAHVLTLRDQHRLAIDPMRVLVDRMRVMQPDARPLRDVCLRIDAPMEFVRGVRGRIRRRWSRAG